MSCKTSEPSPIDRGAAKHRARGYQLEMLEQSMRGNIIVAMDTGSGKTHMSVARDFPEPFSSAMKRPRLPSLADPYTQSGTPYHGGTRPLPARKALCTQQHNVITSHLPAMRTKLLIGSDNVDRWSEQEIWDAALENVRVVVSTHAVLADALSHGFVKITKLALLIFDEAHHCTRGHPANKIMQNFYHPTKTLQGPTSVPHILGLTASPIMRSKISELRLVSAYVTPLMVTSNVYSTIESNLDSISRTPRIQRQEMLKHIHRPILRRLDYSPHDPYESICRSRALSRLVDICQTAFLEQGPLTLELRATVESSRRLGTSRVRGNGTWEDQLTRFCNKAKHIYEELGPWAADYFILESIAALRRSVDAGSDLLVGWRHDIKASLLRILNQDSVFRLEDDHTSGNDLLISHKLERLISFLGEQDHDQCTGLLFVRQRATVSVLSELLSIHPQTKGRFQCAPFVGLSNSASRKYTMTELFDLKAQRETLTEFRARHKNLIIATDVLEEGIDVTACNLVVCFDAPSNLKSFMQRRGRARKERSTFVIMLPDNDDTAAKIKGWQQLEQELIRAYQSDVRRLQDVSAIESISEDIKDEIRVESTGATLTADSAMAHLHHFCALLPPQPYVDLRPAFAFTDDPVSGLITATVTLPNCVNPSVRSTSGCGAWRTERAAMKDAALRAYVALFQAGLLNNNLLPLTHERTLGGCEREDVPATVELSKQFNPWINLAKAWSSPDLHQTLISVQQHDRSTKDELLMVLTTPSVIPSVRPLLMYWDEKTTFSIRLGRPCRPTAIGSDRLQLMREITHVIHRSIHSDHTPDDRMDFIMVFTPAIGEEQFATWLTTNRGRRTALEDFHAHHETTCRGFVRTPLRYGAPYIFHRWRVSSPEQADVTVGVECFPLPKRRNFIDCDTLSKNLTHLTPRESNHSLSKMQRFPAENCTIDLLPFTKAQFSLFIPAILQHIEVLMVAGQLCATILKDVHFKDIQHVVTAISAPSAQWVTDYQRYEFFGDSVLKFTVSCQLFDDHGNWHEGYLSERRNNLVSNIRLAKAVLSTGLDAFIITEPVKGKKWSPMLISEVQNYAPDRRNISTKVLADVVEALIGAAFVDGGFHVARTCIHAFLPDIRIQMPKFEVPVGEQNLCNAIIRAESLVGYQFHNKALLLEALTHPSCDRDIHTESYQRLEYLGDAVLDMLVVSLLAEHKPEQSQGEMTRIKAALVNANLLGFLCMEFSCAQDVINIQEDPAGIFRGKHGVEEVQLWKFMRHHCQEISKAQETCLDRYKLLHNDIRHLLDKGRSYPWVLLAQLNPDKFYSDIVESILGAVFVDSKGDLSECQHFMERIGITSYLRRAMVECIDVVHPRNVLERLAGSDKVQYAVDCEENIPGAYRCIVSINEVRIVEVKGCLTKDESVVMAADAATKLLFHVKAQ